MRKVTDTHTSFFNDRINYSFRKNNLFPDDYFKNKKGIKLKFHTDCYPHENIAVEAEYRKYYIRLSYEVEWYDGDYDHHENNFDDGYKEKIGLKLYISGYDGDYFKDIKFFETIVVDNWLPGNTEKYYIENIKPIKTYLTKIYNKWHGDTVKKYVKESGVMNNRMNNVNSILEGLVESRL